MGFEYRRKRLADVARAVRVRKKSALRDAWSREQVEAYQRRRIDRIVRHAATRSRFYRDRFAGHVGDRPVELAALPAVTKTELMDHYDDVVTDERLRRDELLDHAGRAVGDDLYLGRYRAITTSGSSGRKGLFVWDRTAWSELLAGFLRMTDWAGSTPRLPRRKIAYVGPSGGTHMSRRMATSIDVGIHRMTVVPATAPLREIVATLQRLQPDTLAGFPSMVTLVAQEQLAGRLEMSPSAVNVSSEVCTAEMRATIREAFGVDPFDNYAATEAGIIAAQCPERRAMHVFEDHVAVEVVDADGRPVPPGETGDQVLVTSLANEVQPTIRLAISDMARLDPEPCACGRPFAVLRAVEGRSDDVLHLAGSDGRSVTVHPLSFAPVAKTPEVSEFQVVQRGQSLRVRVALRNGAAPDAVERKLVDALGAELHRLGVDQPAIGIEFCPRIERDPGQMGKLKLVVADPG